MKSKFKLGTKFILLFTAVLTGIFAVLLVVVQVTMATYMSNYIRDSIYSYHEDVDKSVTNVIDEVAYAYGRIVNGNNADGLDGLKSDNSYNVRSQSLQWLCTVAQADEFFADLGWRDKSGYVSVNGYPCPAEEVFTAAEKQRNRPVTGGYINGCQLFVIYMDNDFTQAQGCFVFFMPETTISYCFSDLGTEVGYTYMIRPDGYIFSHGDKSYVGKLFYYENLYSLEGEASMEILKMGDEKKIVIVKPMTHVAEYYGFDFYLVSILDYQYYYGTFETLTWVLAGIMSVVFVAGVLIAALRAKKISKPIAQLHADIEETIATGKKKQYQMNEGDELYGLEKKYDEMISHIFELMDKSREDAETQRKLELDALQMQINPHFLYNTLDAVTWMAKIKKEPEIEKLTVNLAKFFRLSLHKGDKFITVGEELELTRHYLEIDKIRFPDKVTVRFETDESLVNYKVLKLVLQPVVENAVKYAFPNKNGNMLIRTTLDGGDIVFCVEDDGIGFDVPEDILSRHKPETGKNLGGFGLVNVNERIKLEYGEGYGLTVASQKGRGTRVTVRIAKRI